MITNATKILSDEFASQIRGRMWASYSQKITALIEEARSNAKVRPEDAEFFRGIETALNHSMFVFTEVLERESL